MIYALRPRHSIHRCNVPQDGHPLFSSPFLLMCVQYTHIKDKTRKPAREHTKTPLVSAIALTPWRERKEMVGKEFSRTQKTQVPCRLWKVLKRRQSRGRWEVTKWWLPGHTDSGWVCPDFLKNLNGLLIFQIQISYFPWEAGRYGNTEQATFSYGWLEPAVAGPPWCLPKSKGGLLPIIFR